MEHLRIESGHEFLPYARSRIKALLATGQKYASQSFDIGGTLVRVRIEPGHEHIAISGGSNSGYEFWCADKWYVNNPYPGESARGTRDTWGIDTGGSKTVYLSGCATSVAGAKAGKPIYAMALQPLPDGRQWDMLTYAERNLVYPDFAGAVKKWRKINPKDFFTTDSWANQSFQQHHWWYDNKPQQMVHSTGATGDGASWSSAYSKWYGAGFIFKYVTDWASTSVGFIKSVGKRLRVGSRSQSPLFYLVNRWDSSINIFKTSLTTLLPIKYHELDGAWDIRPTAYLIKDGYAHGGHKRSPWANWRHAAVFKAKADDGTVYNYFVSTDTHGVFTFYRAKDWVGSWLQAERPSSWSPFDIQDSDVRVVRPAYPTWVTVPLDSATTTSEHWRWHFNKDATKAATTPLNVVPSYVNTVVNRITLTNGERTISFQSLGGFSLPHFYLGAKTSVPLGVVEKVKIFKKIVEYPADSAGERLNLKHLYGNWFSTAYGLSTEQANEFISSIGDEFAFEIDGKLYPAFFDAGNSVLGESPVILPADISLPRDAYMPTNSTTPGFVEVQIGISINGLDPDDFTPTVTVTSSEAYSEKKAFFIDVGYYIQTPRIPGGQETIADDELLTGEIEIYHKHVDTEYSGLRFALSSSLPGTSGYNPEVKNPQGRLRKVIPLHSPAFANTARTYAEITVNPLEFPFPGSPYTAADRTRDSLEDWILGDHCGVHLFVYYTIRERRTQKVVKRLCLAHDAQWYQGEFGWLDSEGRRWWSINTPMSYSAYADYSTPAGFFGTVEQANLRFLSFLTTTRARKAYVDDGEQGRNLNFAFGKWQAYAYRTRFEYLAQNMPPRFDLRIHGKPIKSVDYSRPASTGFNTAYGNDPMTELAEPPEGAVRLPGKPDDNSFTFCFLQWCAHHLITITHSETFSFCPDGSYAVYADRRSVGLPLGGTTTEAELATGGVFDVIHDHPAKKTTTHKKAFNTAFEQNRDYSYWDVSQGDMGGFSSTGIWLGKSAGSSPSPS